MKLQVQTFFFFFTWMDTHFSLFIFFSAINMFSFYTDRFWLQCFWLQECYFDNLVFTWPNGTNSTHMMSLLSYVSPSKLIKTAACIAFLQNDATIVNKTKQNTVFLLLLLLRNDSFILFSVWIWLFLQLAYKPLKRHWRFFSLISLINLLQTVFTAVRF